MLTENNRDMRQLGDKGMINTMRDDKEGCCAGFGYKTECVKRKEHVEVTPTKKV